jgi:hypothetical protein
LIGLRILVRGNCADDIEEMSGVKESTVYKIFHTFIEKFVEHFYKKFVYFPQGEELIQVLALYSKIGLPGTCGSMDCTHLRWTGCPSNWINTCKGKEKTTTLSFQVVFHLSLTFIAVVSSELQMTRLYVKTITSVNGVAMDH